MLAFSVKENCKHLLSFLILMAGFGQITNAASPNTDVQIKVGITTEGTINRDRIVVALVPEVRLSNSPARTEIAQSNAQFQPFVRIAQSGAIVDFPNKDKFAHHVYSFSKSMSFELPLYRGDQSQNLKLKNNGIVPIGCNIHDWMLGYIAIVDTPYFTFLSGDLATFNDIPTGNYQIMIWHPSMDDFWSTSASISPPESQITLALPVTLRPIAPLPTPSLEEVEEEDY